MQRGWNEAYYFNITGIQDEKNAWPEATNRPKTVGKVLKLNWSLLIFITENAPPVFFENYSAEKRWSGCSPYLHVQLIFSVNRLILQQMNRDFAVMIFYVDFRESLFDYSRAKCFWKGKSDILFWWCYLGRWQSFKLCMRRKLIMFFSRSSIQ